MKWPRRLWNILTLRCEAASELASQAMDEPLELPERLALGGHWLVCAPCRRFRDQLGILREACHRHDFQSLDPETGQDGLTEAAKTRIALALLDAATPDDHGTL